MSHEVRNYCAGAWMDSRSGRRFESTNPADIHETVASVTLSGTDDVDLAVTAARDAFRTWRLTPAPKRGEILFRAAGALMERKEESGRLVTLEMGKVLAEGLGDVQEAIDMAFFMAGEGRRLSGETVPSELPDKDCKSVREPHGVVALITPWNFPTAIPAWKLFPSLICGNTVVLKPSSTTPACAAAIVETLEEAGIPPGVVNLVHGPGQEVGEYLVTHPEVDAVSFTGSCAVGERLQSLLTGLHRPFAAEMGGKNAILVMDDADLDLALEGVLWGAFGTSGQRCTAASRVIVHERIHDHFLEMIVNGANRLRLGPGLNPETDVGPVVNQQQMNRILEYIRIGVDEGAALVAGGERCVQGPCADGYFIRPTVFAGVQAGMRIAREEIFGPVVSVFRCSGIEEGVALANSVQYGLSSAIYSRDVNTTARAERDLKSGLVYINASTIGAEIQLPFGGWKHSGSGHPEAGGRGGALEFYSRTKVIYRDFSGRLQKAQID